MSNQPLVSIALCTYNGERYLKEQLDSIFAQTYPNLQVVAVDDASTDSTYDILKTYSGNYPQLQIYSNQTNLGFVKNFEKAISLCTGELIALSDQDDIWHPEKIALQVAAIKDNMFIYHDSEFVHEDGSPMNKRMTDVLNFYRGDHPEVFLFFNCVSGHSILMRRQLLEYALPLEAGYFHDWWLAYVAANLGTIDFIPQALVKYRQHDKSDTNILRLDRKTDKYKVSSVQNIERTRKWLARCASFEYNKDPKVIQSIYHAYIKRASTYLSFDLSALLFKKRKYIFYVQKKSALSKLNFIYKQIWGSKVKTLFK